MKNTTLLLRSQKKIQNEIKKVKTEICNSINRTLKNFDQNVSIHLNTQGVVCLRKNTNLFKLLVMCSLNFIIGY